MNLAKSLFVVLSFTLVFLFAVLFSQIWLFLILELYMSLPIILPLAVMFYITTDVFTPNKKHNSFYGWIYAEYLEHIIFPLILVFTFLISPLLFIPLMLFLIFYFYGYILGEIKKFKDAISVICLTLLFTFLLWFPDIIFFLNAYLNIGKHIIITFLLLFVISYAIYNGFKTTKLPLPRTKKLPSMYAEDPDIFFFKTYLITIISGTITIYTLLL